MTPVQRVASERRVVLAAFVGHAIEWYEFAVYGALAAYIALAMFPSNDRNTSLLLTWAVFAAAFLVRPVGGVVLARVADGRGRAAGLLLSVLLMSGATAGIGLLPGAAAIGIAAPVFFITLRMLQGFAVGGEMSSSVPYVAESVAAPRRARAMSVLAAGTYAASLIGALLAAVLAAALGPEAMGDWGWRVPFLLALPLGFLAVVVRRRSPESPVFSAPSARRRPPTFLAAMRSQWRPIGVYVGLAIGYNVAVSVALTGYLSEALVAGVPRDQALWVTVIGYLGLITAILGSGPLSRLLGPAPVVVIGLSAALLAIAPAMALARSGHVALVVLGGALLAVPAGVLATPLYLALSDFFDVSVRATAAAVAFNASTAVSSLVPAVTLGLREQWGFTDGLIAWVCAGCAVAALALVIGRRRVSRVER